MRRMFGMAAAATVAGVMALAPAAWASGGLDSGGSGGGGGGGGGGTTTTTVAPASCAQITSFSSSTGYYSIYAAIWTSFSISDACGYPLNWTMSYTNGNTGNVDFVRGSSTQYMSSGTIDEDWAAFSTPYTVTLNVTDASGTSVAMRSAVVTTKQPKSSGV